MNNSGYNEAIALIRQNAFNIRKVPHDIIDERLLRYVRKRHAWALDAWVSDMSKAEKKWYNEVAQNVWVDIIKRDYIDIE
jgi:hypothetical protein